MKPLSHIFRENRILPLSHSRKFEITSSGIIVQKTMWSCKLIIDVSHFDDIGWNKGKWSDGMLADYYWGIKREDLKRAKVVYTDRCVF